MVQGDEKCDPALLGIAEAFFETMGEVLGSRADQMMRREPLELMLET